MRTQDNLRSGVLNKQGMQQVDIDNSRAIANHQMWKWILGGLGGGAAAGAGLGVARMLTDAKPYDPDPSFQSVDVMLPEAKKKQQLGKLAAVSIKTALGGNLGDAAADYTQPMWPTEGLLGKFFGSSAPSPWQVPALYGIGIPATLAAGYAGFKGTHGLTDVARQLELEHKLKKTKEQYGEFVNKNLASKQAADAEIERELDELAELYEKSAAGHGGWLPSMDAAAGDPVAQATNILMSAYSPYAIGSAALAGKLSYDYFKKRTPDEIQEEALRRRAKERYGGTTPIQLEPAPGGSPV